MRKKYSHKILSTLVAIVVLLPFAFQTLHAIEGHEHYFCNAKLEKHFHKKQIDCHFYHLKITYNSFDFNSSFTFYKPHSYFQLFDSYSQTYFYSFESTKSSRAPPSIIA